MPRPLKAAGFDRFPVAWSQFLSLPRQAVEIIRELQPLTGHGDYVLPGHPDPAKCLSEASLTMALAGMGR